MQQCFSYVKEQNRTYISQKSVVLSFWNHADPFRVPFSNCHNINANTMHTTCDTLTKWRKRLTFHNQFGGSCGRVSNPIVSDTLESSCVSLHKLVHCQIWLGAFLALPGLASHVIVQASPCDHARSDRVGVHHTLKECRSPFVLQNSAGDVYNAGLVWTGKQGLLSYTLADYQQSLVSTTLMLIQSYLSDTEPKASFPISVWDTT